MKSESLLNREGTIVHRKKDESPLSKYTGSGVFSMNKTQSRRKIFIIGENAAQHLFKLLLWGEIPL
jgi:hypothetical protein